MNSFRDYHVWGSKEGLFVRYAIMWSENEGYVLHITRPMIRAWCKKEQMSGFISTAFRTLLGYHFHYLSTELIKLNYSFLIRLRCNKQTLVYVRGLLSILSTKVHHIPTFMLGSSMLSMPAVSVALICKLIGIFPRIIIHGRPRLGFQEHVVSIFLICWLQTLSFHVPILLCIIGDVIYSPNFAH